MSKMQCWIRVSGINANEVFDSPVEAARGVRRQCSHGHGSPTRIASVLSGHAWERQRKRALADA